MGDLLGISDYSLATVFGAVIITVFAWDQFKRPSYEANAELRRVVEVLSAADLRRGAVYRYAYGFYAGILLFIYASVTLSGSLFLVRVLGGDEIVEAEPGVRAVDLPQPAELEDAPMVGWAVEAPPIERTETAPMETAGWEGDPQVPLVLSLMMVGLAPAVPILRRLEEKIRFLAHHFSGIPTRLTYAAQELRIRRLGLASHGEGLLVADDDWRRLERYARSARGVRADTLLADVEKIVAFRAWFQDESAGIVRRGRTHSIALFEQDVAERIDRLLLGLDALSDGRDADDAKAERAGPGPEAAWRGFAKEADAIANDVCLLIGLYIEHGLAVSSQVEDASARSSSLGASEAVERARALDLLADFVDGVEQVIEQDAAATRLAKLTIVVATVLSAIAGAVVGAAGVEGANSVDEGAGGAAGWARLGLTYGVTALLVYGPPVVYVSQSYQAFDGRRMLTRGQIWPNVFRTHWSQWIGRLGAILVVSWILAFLFYGGYGMLAAVIAVGGATVAENFGQVVLYALLYDGPLCLQGALLGLALIVGFDEARVRGGTPPGGDAPFLWTPLAGSLAIGLAAALLRALSSQAAAAARPAQAAGAAEARPEFVDFLVEPQALIAAGVAAAVSGAALLAAQGLARRLFHGEGAGRAAPRPGAARAEEPA